MLKLLERLNRALATWWEKGKNNFYIYISFGNEIEFMQDRLRKTKQMVQNLDEYSIGTYDLMYKAKIVE